MIDDADEVWRYFIAAHPEFANADPNSLYPEEYAAWRDFVLGGSASRSCAKKLSGLKKNARPDPGYWTRRGPRDGYPHEQVKRDAEKLVAELGIRHPEENIIRYRLRTGRRPSPESEALRRQLFRNCPDPRFVP